MMGVTYYGHFRIEVVPYFTGAAWDSTVSKRRPLMDGPPHTVVLTLSVRSENEAAERGRMWEQPRLDIRRNAGAAVADRPPHRSLRSIDSRPYCQMARPLTNPTFESDAEPSEV